MKMIDSYTEAFQLQWEKFGIGCEAAEQDGKWNRELDGPLMVYCEDTLLKWMVRMISLDGYIAQEELDYLNQLFGSSYTMETLEKDLPDREGGSFLVAELMKKLERLDRIDGELADAFRGALDLSCSIIAASDQELAADEKKALATLRTVLS